MTIPRTIQGPSHIFPGGGGEATENPVPVRSVSVKPPAPVKKPRKKKAEKKAEEKSEKDD